MAGLINNVDLDKTTESTDDSCKQNGAGSPKDKKRRRGQIEKNRRDRINNSLYELKRLVPGMIGKPNTTKLEKAEILQSTVSFIKRLYHEGYMTGREQRQISERFAGFNECVEAVLKNMAAMDSLGLKGDELRDNILSHLVQMRETKQNEIQAHLTHMKIVNSEINNRNAEGPVQPAIYTQDANKIYPRRLNPQQYTNATQQPIFSQSTPVYTAMEPMIQSQAYDPSYQMAQPNIRPEQPINPVNSTAPFHVQTGSSPQWGSYNRNGRPEIFQYQQMTPIYPVVGMIGQNESQSTSSPPDECINVSPNLLCDPSAVKPGQHRGRNMFVANCTTGYENIHHVQNRPYQSTGYQNYNHPNITQHNQPQYSNSAQPVYISEISNRPYPPKNQATYVPIRSMPHHPMMQKPSRPPPEVEQQQVNHNTYNF